MTDNMMAQNLNTGFMRQMQQQLAPMAAQQRNPNQQTTTGLGLQNGLGNFNANVIMNAFQATPQGQNAQQGSILGVQRAENILAAALAAAGNNAQNQAATGGGQHPQQQPHHHQQQQQPTFTGLEGLEQLQGFQGAGVVAPPGGPGIPDLRRQSLALQEQLANLKQQLGQGQQQSQQQPQQQHFVQSFNPATFNSAALSLNGGFAGQNNNFQPDMFAGQSNAGPLVGNAGVHPFPQHQNQQQQPERRNSSLSTASMSPVGKQKTLNPGNGFSNLFPPTLAVPKEEAPTKSKRGSKGTSEKKRKAKTFPEKLMQAMMEYGDEEAVAWLPDGKSFVIVNPELFCNEVLSRFFKESKYASFVRKLHRWGFVRLTSGTGTDCFHHPGFQKNRKEMAGRIVCAPRGDKDKHEKLTNAKPPSLAGVEKFIRAKVASAAANAEQKLLMGAEEDLDENGKPGMVL